MVAGLCSAAHTNSMAGTQLVVGITMRSAAFGAAWARVSAAKATASRSTAVVQPTTTSAESLISMAGEDRFSRVGSVPSMG